MWVKVFVLCAFSVGSLYSDNDSKCDITGIPSVDWVLGYESNMNDNEINKRIFNGTYTGKLDNLKCSCTIDNPNSVCKETYFQATLDTKTTQFLVETTDALKNFDEDINTILSKPQPSLLLFYKCNMTCQNPTTPSLLPFAITVKDYNDFRPDFSTGDTVYKVSSPIMKEADFSVYGAEIYATDKDFGNEDITFKIDPDDFDIVKTVTDDKPRKFKVNFKANKVLQLTQDKKYTITATDSGKIPGPLSSTLQVTLKVDPENVVDYPNFEYTSKSYEYAFRYEKNHTLTTINGPIKVTTNKPSDLEKSISLSGDLSGNFGATFDTSSSTIKVSIKTNIDNPTSAFVVLSLNVQTDAKVSAPVVIYFANAPKDDTPKFNQHLYTGKYDDSTNKISLDQDITVLSTSALSTSSFKITGDFSGNFEIKLDDDKKSYLLDVNKALTPTEIKSKEYLSLTIEVTVDSKSDTTGVIVYLPAHALEFKEVLYTATYFENNTIAANTISFASDVTNSKVSVKVEDTYSKNFEVKPTSKGDYALGLISNLPDAVLQTQTEISIVLTASDKYDNQAQSIVKMALPQQKAVEAPKFSQLAYKIKYNEGQKSGVLDFDTPPSFVNYADPSAIKIDLKTYAKYFTVAFDSTTKKFGVKVLQALDSSFLKNNELVETMVAVKTNVAAKGNAVLVVELVKLKPGSPPTFEKPSYTAVYKKGLKVNDYIDFDQVVSLKNVVNLKNVAIKLDSNEANFKVLLESNKWRIQLLKPIDDDTFSKINDIVITMEVSESGISGQSIGVLVINLSDPSKDDKAPNFEKPFYTVQYNTTAKYMDFEPAIKFTNVDVGSVQMTLSDRSDNFELVLNNGIWMLKISKPLDESILENSTEIAIKIEATENGLTGTGYSVLILELTGAKKEAPEFKNPYYLVQYQKTDSFIDFNPAIAFDNIDVDKVILVINTDYKDYFQMDFDSNKWRIKVLKPLTDELLLQNELVTTIEASEDGVTKKSDCVLVMNLKDNTAGAPQFKDPYYNVQYNTTVKYMDFEPAINFNNVDVGSVKMTLSDRSDNFELVLDNGIWKLKISKPLDESILENSTEIAIKIEATEKGLTGTGYSVLILELTGAKKEAPAFKNPYYLVQYQKTDSYIDFNPAIAFDNIDVDKVILVINTDYKDYFQMDFDSNKWRIKVLKPLTDELLLQNELVTTIEASEDGVTKKSDCVLVMNLKDNTAGAPQFKDPYYNVQYNTTVKYMDFEPAINFNNVDVGSVKMTLSDRSDNFELVLDNGIWKLKISKPLDESILENTTEIAIKIEATEKGLTGTGYSVLILELTGTKKEAPEFKNPYYLVQYQKDQEADSYIDFNPAIAFDNVVVDKVTLVINTDYKDYFKMDFDSNKWRIKVLKPLTDELLLQNELVTTIQASEDGVTKKSDCVLVMNLKDNTAGAPQFKDPYYIVQYNTTVKYMDFKPAIKFTNVDVGSVQITLSDRSDNFELVLDNGIWKLKIAKPLDESILENLTEIAIKMEAAEKGLTGTGYSVLILELTGAKKEAPEFKNPYYLVQYQKDQKAGSYLDFSPAIAFDNINVDKAVLKLSDYSKYFELDLDATKKLWRIKVIAPLDDAILKHNAELHTTMEATEMGVTGVGVLIIQIPNNSQDKAPEFSDLYYKVVYKQGQTGFLDFTNDIAFNNVPDISIVDINLYTYMDNFKLVYNNKKWRILIDRALDDKVFATSTTLVDTMEASLPDVIPAGDVVLMIDLVANVPQFGNDYYTAAYPVGGSGIFYFDNDLDFKNVDPKDVQLYLDNYYGNFNITYNSVAKKWQIDIKTPLDDSVISKNEYLVTKLTAKIVSIGSELTATVVLKLPKKQAPVFSKTSFKAEYTIQKNHPVVTFTDSIGFKNKPNMANINIVSDDFSGYFTFKYSTNSWQMIVDRPLDSTNLDKTNLVVTITAIDNTDMLQAHSTIDLKLPPADTKDAPKFEKSYYKGRYEVVKDVGKVILDEDIHFSNKVGHTDIGIIPDSGYNQFFEFSLDLQSKWTVLVKKPLNASILSSGNDIIMQLVANELGIKDVGKSTLLLTLPKINDDQAPKFDHISYRSLCSANTTKLDIEIKVTNRKKEDLKNIVVAIQEDEYRDNFDVKFDAATSSWYVEVKSTPKTMGDKNNLVLTLSATESNNKTEVGLAGLVIEFPVFIAPEFSANPYVGTYNVADGTLKIIDFNVVNKDQSKLKLTFSSKDGDFSKYLSINYDKADKIWKMLLTNPIDKLTVTNNDEIVLTITAKENDNPKQGETTAIIKIIDESKNKNDIQFSRAHYSASYRIVDNKPVVKLNEYIRVTSTKDVTKATVNIQSASDFEPVKYFKIAKKTDHFEIIAREPLTIDILRKFTNLIVTLMVKLENTKNYATLIIDLSAVESGDDIKFNSVVYMGTYENRNNVNKITCDPINVITTSPENIYVSITNAYKEYFSLTYNAKDSSVALNLAKSIPASVIEDFSTVAVVVQAMNGLSHKIANAVINLRIISDDTPVKNGVVLFNKISNTAKYLQGSFTLDNSIGLTTDRKEDEIKASIEDSAFSKYFTAYYKNQEVTVKLTREIPQETITSKPFITLTLVVSIVNTNETSKASLTVQLDNDHHETLKATKYIVSISLLAVLIVLLILAAVAFYYLRLRKKNEAKMTEDEYIEKREVRFESTSRPSDKLSRSSAIEERRPTGFIFKRQDEDEDESSTDGSAKERKKSVVFDEVVEKMKMEDKVEKPDIDD